MSINRRMAKGAGWMVGLRMFHRGVGFIGTLIRRKNLDAPGRACRPASGLPSQTAGKAASNSSCERFTQQGRGGVSGENRLSILIFHRVLAEGDPLQPDIPTAARFERQMRWLARRAAARLMAPPHGGVLLSFSGACPCMAGCCTRVQGDGCSNA